MSNLGAINVTYDGDLNASAPGSPSPQQFYTHLRSLGAKPGEALLLTGAGASESGLNPNAVHDNGVGYGLFGHNGSRLMALKQYAQQSGGSIGDWRTQGAFALQELRSRPEGASAANATTPEQAAMAQMFFERPQGFTMADPTQGHNYLGRLNTLRRFTALDPNATGSMAASANPQVTPEQYLGGTMTTAVASPATRAKPQSSELSSPFAAPGDNTAMIPATVNQALANVLASTRQQTEQQPLVSQLIGQIGAPLHQALGQPTNQPLLSSLLGSARGGLGSLLGGSSPIGAGDGMSPSSAPAAPAPSAPPAAPSDATAIGPAAGGPLLALAGLAGG